MGRVPVLREKAETLISIATLSNPTTFEATAPSVADQVNAHFRARRWRDAADAAVAARDLPVILQGKIARNLASLQEHRPAVYSAVLGAAGMGDYSVVGVKEGQASIQMRRQDGSNIVLSPNHDPVGAVRNIFGQLSTHIARGETLLLSGAGDGYMLAALARNPPKLLLGMEQVIYLAEPDPAIFWSIFMIHDLSGPGGAIEQRRFQWHVGPHWLQSMRTDLTGDFLLPFPITTIRQSLASAQMDEQMRGLLLEIGQADAGYKTIADGDAQQWRCKDVNWQLGTGADPSTTPNRRPRVLLLTTRFSTVLQYSTRDAADALRALDCETLVLIEPDNHTRVTRPAIRKAIATFKPDLIFQIDHLRHEHGDVFPTEIPFVCWIQDNLPNLTSVAAAGKVGQTDFILTPSLERYTKTYGYPSAQCLEFRKLTRSKVLSSIGDQQTVDLTYVSNWSQPPEILADQHVKDWSPTLGATFVQAVSDRMIAIYRRGESLPTPGDVRRLVQATRADIAATNDDAHTFERFQHALCEKLNNGLYRQQGLAWAVDIAKSRGLTLEIYGEGWDRHPAFATYARGKVEYGLPLEELTHRSRINLVLEPFVCFAHQRFLDAMMAGGFALVRAHPGATLMRRMLEILNGVDLSTYTEAALLEAASPEQAALVRQILEMWQSQDACPGRVDFVASTAALRASHLGASGAQFLADLDAISFSSGGDMDRAISRYLSDEPARQTQTTHLHDAVASRFSYEAGMTTMLGWIGQRLSQLGPSPRALPPPFPAVATRG